MFARQLPTAAAYEADRRNKCCFCNFDYLNQASNRRNANPAFTGACILCPEHGQVSGCTPMVFLPRFIKQTRVFEMLGPCSNTKFDSEFEPLVITSP